MTNYVQQVVDDLAARLPRCNRGLLNFYALLVLTRGTAVTLEDVHNAWSLWRTTFDPTHPFLVPFDDLTEPVRALDLKYAGAIFAAARQLSAVAS